MKCNKTDCFEGVCSPCIKEHNKKFKKPVVRPVKRVCNIAWKVCKECNIDYYVKARANNSTYCSTKCRAKSAYKRHKSYYYKYARRNQKTFISNCRICETKIVDTRPDRTICSNVCKLEYSRIRRLKPRYCIGCNKDISGTGRMKYCSNKCNPKMKKSPRRCAKCNVIVENSKKYCSEHKPKYIKKQYNKICHTCSSPFISSKINTKYCKPNCQPSKRARKRVERRSSKSVLKDFVVETEKIYQNRPDNAEIDHIVPLRHELVCGLHVYWNLQYLSPEENRKKSNIFDGTYENNSWE